MSGYAGTEVWTKIRGLAKRLESPYADKVYVAENYTKDDLRKDLLAVVPDWAEVEEQK